MTANKIEDIWLISDTHFSHSNSLKFISSDGLRMRREFDEDDVDAMDEAMIANWNSVIKPEDKVYHVGDVGFQKGKLETILPRLNGKKRLILGNHDRFDMGFYSKFFGKIMESWTPMRGVVISHRPVYIGPGESRIKANIHGHIHRGQIEDPRYYNISVEETNYHPIRFGAVLQIFRDRGIEI